MKYLNLVSSLLAVVLLNGCLEVEDNDNSDIQTLIDNQTQTITESNQMTIKGVVVDALDSKPVNNALITVMVGSKAVISDFEVTNGDFELTGLPHSSDIEIIISSPDNKFLSRTFFTQTFYGSKDSVDDFGTFAVSESVDVEISVIDNENSSALTTLEFVAFSHSGTNSSAYKYQHVSTFNADTGIYTITLPKFIDTSVRANLDIDKDGEVDYLPELNNLLNGRDLYIGSANTKEFSTIYINEVQAASDLEIRLSLVDETAQPLLGAKFYVEDSAIDTIYDELTNQYVIAAKIKDSLSIQLPAFESNEIKYQSSAFTVSKLDDGNLQIVKTGVYNHCCVVIPTTNVIDFALSPQAILESDTAVKVVLAASDVNPVDSSFSVFYSQAVEVDVENILLTNDNAFTVLRGDADESDEISAGTTLIAGGISFPVTFALSLNDTRLTVTPLTPLSITDSYHYNIKSVMNKATLEKADIDNDELTFEFNANTDEVFLASDIKLDNENYTANGVTITASNTAGDSANPSNWSNYAQLYFPLSIHSLQKLTLRQSSVVKDGISYVDFQEYNVVTDGVINAEDVGIVRLAENESVINQGFYRQIIVKSAQMETQKVYRSGTYVYISDNTSTKTNSISFDYSLETKTGEVSTGSITIPVQ